MKTFLAQNQFGASVPCADETAGSSPAPLPAVPLSVSDAEPLPASMTSGTEVVASVRTAAASDIDCIPEIFRVSNLQDSRQFIPDRHDIWDAMHDPNAPRALETDPVWADDAPIFLRGSA